MSCKLKTLLDNCNILSLIIIICALAQSSRNSMPLLCTSWLCSVLYWWPMNSGSLLMRWMLNVQEFQLSFTPGRHDVRTTPGGSFAWQICPASRHFTHLSGFRWRLVLAFSTSGNFRSRKWKSNLATCIVHIGKLSRRGISFSHS